MNHLPMSKEEMEAWKQESIRQALDDMRQKLEAVKKAAGMVH
jgi:hypothetical protein